MDEIWPPSVETARRAATRVVVALGQQPTMKNIVRLMTMGAGVWIVAQQFTNEDFTAVSQMTVLELSGRRLISHSRAALDPKLQRAVASLGKVTGIIASNRWHHQFPEEWQRAFPDALLFGRPSLA